MWYKCEDGIECTLMSFQMVPNWIDALDGVLGNHPPLLLWWVSSSAVLGPVLGCPVQVRHGFIGASCAKGLEDGSENQVSRYMRSHLEYLGCFRLEENRLRRVLSMCRNTQQREQRKWSQTLPSGAQWHGERQQPKLKYRKSNFNMRKYFVGVKIVKHWTKLSKSL